jgi:hypothetical protein
MYIRAHTVLPNLILILTKQLALKDLDAVIVPGWLLTSRTIAWAAVLVITTVF